MTLGRRGCYTTSYFLKSLEGLKIALCAVSAVMWKVLDWQGLLSQEGHASQLWPIHSAVLSISTALISCYIKEQGGLLLSFISTPVLHRLTVSVLLSRRDQLWP